MISRHSRSNLDAMEKITPFRKKLETNDRDRRCFSHSTERNRDPILEVLKRVLPETGTVVEIGSGTGQHAAFFVPLFPELEWQPTDIEPELVVSIDAWRHEVQAPNLLPAIHLDVLEMPWPVIEADAVVSCNMIHIAPWVCCEALIAGAAEVLPSGGVLFLYGPFQVGGVHISASNTAFDLDLRSRNPEWGVRNLDDVAEQALERGFQLAETVRMPANNLSVIFNRKG